MSRAQAAVSAASLRASPRLWRVGIVLAIAHFLMLFIGGCSVWVEGEKPASPKVERVLEAGEGSWDLRGPPSRKEAGMPSGEPYVLYEPHGWWRDPPLRAHVLLPDGERIDTEARYVAFDSYGSRSEGAAPTTMDISAGPMSLDEANRQMLRTAGELGLSRSEIEEWYAGAKRAVSREDANGRVKTPFLRSRVGYLTIEVQGSFLPHGNEINHAFVHYIFNWGP